MSKEEIKELAEDNAIYEFRKFQKIYGSCTDEYVRHFYNKLAELRSEIPNNHTCNCQHNNNSRDNEPCCRCDSRHTNADRIRNMSDEDLACVIEKIKMCGGLIRTETTSAECNGCKDGYCCNVIQWLQSEAE